ncbi:hypothetical protein CYLTODRAFT_445671 [Cylindrobasidium torrendii FP15055 ss-10]|uniref:Uncharacterized protein n=1 Tax=Cylindrobasidium torrendii FP15055 ss-10 TaxID=1314674 RepID=A0A0D7B420_9AGAR|nr:hypothetical protein CYLTODRAFT_445671 [Cylindrobasidium torrendii FP15055 ss-10]
MFFTRVAATLAIGSSLFASAAPTQYTRGLEVEVEVEVEVSDLLNELLGVTSTVLPQLAAVTDITEATVLPLVKQLTDALTHAADGLGGIQAPAGGAASSAVGSATSAAGSVTSSVVGTATSVLSSATSVVSTATSVAGSAAAPVSTAASEIAARDGKQEVAQLLNTVLSDVGNTLNPILGDLQKIPAVAELLQGLSPVLNTVLTTVDALLPGVVDLVSGLVGPVVDLLKGLGLGDVLGLLGL